MAKKEKRFVRVYHQGAGFSENSLSIYVDKVTGVNYLYSGGGYGGGMTVLLNRDGTPVVSPLPIEEE